MSDIKERFSILLNHFAIFNKIDYLFIENKNEKTIVTGFSKAKNVMVVAEMPELPYFTRKVCFSDLPFLRRLFEMEQVKNDAASIDFIEGKDFEQNDMLERIIIRSPRLNITYATVDPKVVQNKPPSSVSAKWISSIELAPEQFNEYQEAYSLQKMMAKKEEDQLTKFLFTDGNLIAEMPYTKTESVSLVFKKNIDEFRLKSSYNSAMISNMLSVMKDDGGGVMTLSDTMLKIDTIHGDIEFTMYLVPSV